MATPIRSLADLHLIKDALRLEEQTGEPHTRGKPSEDLEVFGVSAETLALPDDGPAERAALEQLLSKHDLWLGYSPIKGWALLDRKHPEYSSWNRPFVLMANGSIDRLSRLEFNQEPNGPWKLDFWKRLAGKARAEAGPATALLPEIRRYIDSVEQAARYTEKLAADRNEDFSTRIGDPPFDADLYFHSGLEFHEQWATAKNAHYANALPARVNWLRGWARKMKDGESGPEPVWSRGIGAARYLSDQGITHLWHFTDSRNIAAVIREGGLYSWAGLAALGITDVHMMADDLSRTCDARLGRERYVRLSFIPNSWFFHRVRWSRPSVWMRFCLRTLALGEIAYSLGNAASGFVPLREDLTSMGIDWRIVTPFSAQCSHAMGPTSYPRIYQDQVGDPFLFRRISNAWNSEVLIKHFLPIEFCDGIFDSRTGLPVGV